MERELGGCLMIDEQDCGKLCWEFAGVKVFIGVKELDQ